MTNVYDTLDEEHLVTPDEAAILLNVTLQYLRTLIQNGDIPIQPENCAGNDAVILYSDLIAYRDKRDKERRKNLAELTRISQEAGFYDD